MIVAKTRQKRFGWFLVGLEIYALLAVVGVFFGLRWLWGYLEAYEKSQLYNTVDAFMEQVNVEDMYGAAQSLTAQTDINLQKPEVFYDLIEEAVSGGVTCARNRKLSTQEQVVYMLLSSGKTIGQVSFVAGEPDEYGHAGWKVSEQSYNFDFLLEGLHNSYVTVPSTYTVTVNGYPLDKSYITQDGIQFEAIAEYYEDYDLPCRVTYTTGYVLGDLEMVITDEQGNVVTPEEAADDARFLDNCSEEEKQQIDAFVQTYLNQYVKFLSSNNDNRNDNYKALLTLIAKDSFLRTRMKASLDGLQWTNGYTHKIDSITMNGYIRLSEGVYLCDVTYVGTTRSGSSVNHQSVNNMQMILVIEGKNLVAEATNSY